MASEHTLVGQGRPTYWASVSALAVAASGTDVFTLTGAIGRRITPLMFGASGVATSDGAFSIAAVKRSTANTGGTSSTRVAVPGSSSNAAPAKGIVRAYTANPTLGTLVGSMMAKRISYGAPAGTVGQVEAIFDFRSHYCGPVELLSDQEVLALNLGGVTVSGGLLDAWVAWTEEYGMNS